MFTSSNKVIKFHFYLLFVMSIAPCNNGRFPFDQKFRKFRVWERMEQTFSGISFRNFGCTSRRWPKIPENSVPFDHSCCCDTRFRTRSTLLSVMSNLSATAQAGSWLAIHQRKAKTRFGGGMAPRPDPFPSGILPVGMTARVNSSQVSLVILK